MTPTDLNPPAVERLLSSALSVRAWLRGGRMAVALPALIVGRSSTGLTIRCMFRHPVEGWVIQGQDLRRSGLRWDPGEGRYVSRDGRWLSAHPGPSVLGDHGDAPLRWDGRRRRIAEFPGATPPPEPEGDLRTSVSASDARAAARLGATLERHPELTPLTYPELLVRLPAVAWRAAEELHRWGSIQPSAISGLAAELNRELVLITERRGDTLPPQEHSDPAGARVLRRALIEAGVRRGWYAPEGPTEVTGTVASLWTEASGNHPPGGVRKFRLRAEGAQWCCDVTVPRPLHGARAGDRVRLTANLVRTRIPEVAWGSRPRRGEALTGIPEPSDSSINASQSGSRGGS